ncbi:MAG: phage holin family protein [Thermanaerothrix sp.]|nr:phage holin family protein [Thermanaerothrix sp.]
MEQYFAWLRYLLAGLGGLATALFGGWDVYLKVLVAFMVLDYLTGVIAAYQEKKLDSNVGWKGITRKALIFVIVALAHLLDTALGQELFRGLVIWFYIANEGLSVVENLGRAGVPIPAPLRAALESLKQKAEEGKGNA